MTQVLPAATLPLVVDLDGTLVRSDMLIESALAAFRRNPLEPFRIISAVCSGTAALKHHLASSFEFDPEVLPYDEAVLAEIHKAAAAGRPVYLVSGSNARIVSAIANHLGMFKAWFGSEADKNLSGEAKAGFLVEAFGEGGFDYIGNGASDIAIWPHAAERIGIRLTTRVAKRLAAIDPKATHLPSQRVTLNAWLRLLRIHQYVKNTLVFVAVVTAHAFTVAALLNSTLAAIAFCLCASSGYVLNDLLDLAGDRVHPTKRDRPIANGTIPLAWGIIAVPTLLLAAATIASIVSLSFLTVLSAYFVLTATYSIYLKRKVMVDVVVLAMLYTIRVVGGAVAIEVPMSEWLLAFSMFIFTGLALVKRYTELTTHQHSDKSAPTNRGYVFGDLDIIAPLAAASGFNAVVVFALYISSDAVHQLYRHPQVLWLACPVLVYWFSHILIVAHRRQMHDDPIVFALTDRASLISFLLIGLVILAASW